MLLDVDYRITAVCGLAGPWRMGIKSFGEVLKSCWTFVWLVKTFDSHSFVFWFTFRFERGECALLKIPNKDSKKVTHYGRGLLNGRLDVNDV